MSAPQPQLVVSDGGDWTNHMPEHDLLYRKIYSWYGRVIILPMYICPMKNTIFGFNKRKAVYMSFCS